MQETKQLRQAVMRTTVLMAVIIEIISLFFTKGFNLHFAYGLAVGTAVADVNFTLLAFMLEKAVIRQKKSAIIFYSLGFVGRLAIFGGAFYLCYVTSQIAGLSCVIGFITVQLAIYFCKFVLKKGI